MKRNVLMLLLIACFGVASAQTKNNKLIIGLWKYKSLTVEYPDSLQGKAKEDAIEDMTDLKRRLAASAFNFKKDGTCIIAGHNGTWRMDNDGKKVVYHNDKNEETTSKIIWLTHHKLKFVREDDGLKQTFTLNR